MLLNQKLFRMTFDRVLKGKEKVEFLIFYITIQIILRNIYLLEE